MNTISEPEKIEQALIPVDPDQKARYLAQREHTLRVAATRDKSWAWAKLARGSDRKRAAAEFLAEPGAQERKAMILALSYDELISFAKSSTKKLQDALLELFVSQGMESRQLRIALTPADQLQRHVEIALAVTGRRVLDNGSLSTAHARFEPGPIERRIDVGAYKSLLEFGKHLVRTRTPYNEVQYYYLPYQHSEHPSDVLAMSEAELLARLPHDKELRDAIACGALRVQTRTPIGCADDHPDVAKLKSHAPAPAVVPTIAELQHAAGAPPAKVDGPRMFTAAEVEAIAQSAVERALAKKPEP
jgi:hypothetical protein